jgi:uncharacterized membrane protein YtjA (UPF0391 family)
MSSPWTPPFNHENDQLGNPLRTGDGDQAELCWHRSGKTSRWRCPVLYWAFMFLIVGLIAAALGFTNLAGGAFGIAKFLAGLFLVLFLIFLVLGLTAAKKIID